MIVAIALWIVVIAVAIFVESNTSTLVSMWFIPAGLVALILALLDMGFIWQFAAFAAISLICLILSRTAFRHMLTKGEQVLNNVDRLKGMDALVVSDIGATDAGEVKVDGKIWRAFTVDNSPASAGEILRVHHVESTRIYCERK